MLTKRQFHILSQICDNENQYISATTISKKLNVSLRTVQNELKEIKEEVFNMDFIRFISVPSKGTRIEILDHEKFSEFIIQNKKSSHITNLNTREGRTIRIISILLSYKTPISIQHIADRLFISKSTFMNDLNTVEHILDKYNLKIVSCYNSGIKIEGAESDIRRCMIKEQVDMLFYLNQFVHEGTISEEITEINNIVVDVLMDLEYHISDIVLQNFIIHLAVMVNRLKKGFHLEELYDLELEDKFYKELIIAKRIVERCSFTFHIPSFDAEVNRLAVYLKAKVDYSESSYISEEIDNFVLDTLSVINEKFNINFIDNVELRLSLSLHLMPLLIRLEYNMQLKNDLLNEIRSSYQLAFDIAYQFAREINKKYHYKLSEDEIGYFAIYFNSAITIYHQGKGTNKILIISSLKRSETLLLRERINSWFSDSVNELKIVTRYEVENINLDDYNVVCTTEKNEYYEMGDAILLSQFPSEKDRRMLKMLLDGFNGKEEFLSLFNKDSFIKMNRSSKSKVLDTAIEFMLKEEECHDLKRLVLQREEMGGTYFGNHVAMPHPTHPITNKSHISVIIVKNGITWDDYNNVAKVILLLSIEKNSAQAYTIWSYFSELIKNEELINSIIDDPTYENFINQISLWLDNKD